MRSPSSPPTAFRMSSPKKLRTKKGSRSTELHLILKWDNIANSHARELTSSSKEASQITQRRWCSTTPQPTSSLQASVRSLVLMCTKQAQISQVSACDLISHIPQK